MEKKISPILSPLFFFLLGTLSVLGQSVLLREITSLFFGNEIFYGLGLSFWLLFTGLGSYWAGKRGFFKKLPLWGWLIFLFCFLPFLVIFLRFLAAKLILPGQLPSLPFVLVGITVLFFIYCFPQGALFAFFSANYKNKDKGVNLGYFWETVGFFVGGVFFSFILATTSFPLLPEMERKSLSWRYQPLSSVTNSAYHQIVVTQKDNQENVFLGGQLSFSSESQLENRQILSLIIPFASKLESVLLIGPPTFAKEIRKISPFSLIEFLEADEKLLAVEKKYLDSQVKVLPSDPRFFLKGRKGKYDLVLLSLGNPQTLLTNRYFTKEFFAEVKQNLGKNGIFVLLLYIPTDKSQEALNFAASIYQALKENYKAIQLFTPQDQLIFLNSQEKLIFEEKKIDFIFKDYFFYQLRDQKREEILQKLASVKAKVNTDNHPSAFFYQQLFWQTMFNFQTPKIFLKISQGLPLILIILSSLVFFFKCYLGRSQPFSLGLTMGIYSFILMSLEIVLILSFQTKIGYLYSQISLILH